MWSEQQTGTVGLPIEPIGKYAQGQSCNPTQQNCIGRNCVLIKTVHHKTSSVHIPKSPVLRHNPSGEQWRNMHPKKGNTKPHLTRCTNTILQKRVKFKCIWTFSHFLLIMTIFYVNTIMSTYVTSCVWLFIIFDYFPRYRGPPFLHVTKSSFCKFSFYLFRSR